MNAWTAVPDRFVLALGWTLVHFLWQGTLIALLLAIANRVFPRNASGPRYVLAAGALAAMMIVCVATFASLAREEFVTPPAVPVAQGEPAHEAQAFESPARPATALTWNTPEPLAPAGDTFVPAPSTSAWDAARIAFATALRMSGHSAIDAVRTSTPLWMPWFVALWGLGVGFLTLRLLGGWVVAQRIKRRIVDGPTAELQASLDRLARRIGVSRPVRVFHSMLVEVPTVIGWLRPVVLVPMSAMTGLTPRQIEALLAHELAHIRRHDYLVNLLQTVVETVLFYHPAVWWVSRRVREERENCCDDIAVAACGDRVVYARALCELEHLRLANSRFALAANGGSLTQRIRRLVDPAPATSVVSRCGAGVIVIGAVLLVVLGLAPATARHDADPAPGTAIFSVALVEDTAWGFDMAPAARRGSPAPRAFVLAAPAPEPAPAPLPDEVNVHYHLHLDEETGAYRVHAGDPTEACLDEDLWLDLEVIPGTAPVAPVPAVPPVPSIQAVPSVPTAPVVPSRRIVPVPRVAPVPAPEGAGGRWVLGPIDAEALKKAALEAGADVQRAVAQLVQKELPRYAPRAAVHYAADRARAFTWTATVRGDVDVNVPASYREGLRRAGYAELDDEELLRLWQLGVTPEYAREMPRLLDEELDEDDLVHLMQQDVSPTYVREMRAVLGDGAGMEDFVDLRQQGVSAEYAREMRNALGRVLDKEELVGYRRQGVDAGSVRAMQRAGMNLEEFSLVELRSHGISLGYATQMRRYRGHDLTLDQLILLKERGVTPESLAFLKLLGYGDLTVDQIVSLADHGVSAEIMAQAVSTFGRKVDVDEIIDLVNHGVNVEYVANLVRSTDSNLEVPEIIELFEHGVPSMYLSLVMRSGYAHHEVDDVVRLHDHGVKTAYIENLVKLGYANVEPEHVVALYEQSVSTKAIEKANQEARRRLNAAELLERARAGKCSEK